jgi:hypothetical protein
VGNEIHIYFHVVNEDDPDVAVLRATIAVLEARLVAEVPSTEDLAVLDVLLARANGLAATGPPPGTPPPPVTPPPTT